MAGGEPLQAPSAPRKKKVGIATFATGIVHGLQPDALLIVFPALTLPLLPSVSPVAASAPPPFLLRSSSRAAAHCRYHGRPHDLLYRRRS
jgi:hypothetical protein